VSNLKAALIGCGNISSHHLKAFQRIGGVSIECVADIDVDRARAVAEEFGVPRTASSVEEALDVCDVDFVDVCTPTFAHGDVVKAAAAAGKHVVCEKPVSLTSEEGQEMTDACRAAGVKLMVAFRYRFTPWAPLVRERVQRGDLGRPIIWRQVQASSGPKMRYMFDRSKAGGFFMDLYVHHIDMAHYLFGKAQVVFGNGFNMKSELPSCDTGTAVITFERGDQLVISATLGLPGWDWVWQVGGHSDFVGPLGVLKEPLIQSGNRGFITVATAKDQEDRLEYPKQPPLEDFDSELRHFMECVRDDREPIATGEDGVAATRTVEAIYESIALGQPVTIAGRQ